MFPGEPHRNEFEGRFKQILDQARRDPHCILFFDELHQLCSAQNDVSQMIKADLGRGNLRLIGATTHEEYRSIGQDLALARRLQVIPVEELTPQQTLEILDGLKGDLEAHHGIPMNEECLALAVDLSVTYIQSRRLPDKVIDLLDEGAAYQVIHPPEVTDDSASTTAIPKLLPESIYQVVSTWTGIPVPQLQATDELSSTLDSLPEHLSQRILGQDKAIQATIQTLRRSLLLYTDQHRPRSVLMFVGPSGVGKTELAKALAESLYGDGKYLKRLEMTEFNDEHTVARLVGSPPGYVGYGRGGELVNALKSQRHGVLLLDEIEKAHPRIMTETLLTLLGDGVIHDMNSGEMVDARNWIIIMTSNLGTNQHLRPGEGIQETLPHEFLGRIDRIIPFQSLSPKAIQSLWMRERADLLTRLRGRFGEGELLISSEAERYLVTQSHSKFMDARTG